MCVCVFFFFYPPADYEEQVFIIGFLSCKGLSKDDVEVERGTLVREIRPGAGFKTGDLFKERSGEIPENDSPPPARAMPAWSVETRRARCLYCRAYGHTTTTAIHQISAHLTLWCISPL